jgi:HAE1 family hydrophobic/amphiphilic exporter-1
MNIAEMFIRRPVMTTLLMLGIVIFGVFAFKLLPVSDLPNVDFPTIQVTSLLPGASPETMASSVATPLERQFSTISGLDSMSSTSQLGQTQITLQFNLSRNIDAAAQDVQAAIAQALGRLPKELPTPPSYQKINPADQPILYIALTSDTLPLSTVDDYGETTMAESISTVNGVAQVLVYGAQKYAVRVKVNPAELNARQIGINEVGDAVINGNVNTPTGTLYGRHRAYTINATGQLTNAAAYKPLIVTYRNGAPVRLEEVATPIDSVSDDKGAAWFVKYGMEQRAIILAIQRQPGTNTVEVASDVKKLLPKFRKQLPASINIEEMYDRSQGIKASVNDVEFTLMLTLALVVMVIFLFLRNVFATVIPSLTLPIAVVGTFAMMYLLNYSIDNLSLMALTLSVGFVVDDAIVMLENIVRHNELGKPVFQAALDGSREVGFTIVSMTLSLAAVFIPVLFMPGIVGRLFREFSVTIGIAVIVSGIVALTLTPMLTSRFLRSAKEIHHGRIYNASEQIFNGALAIYERALRFVLRHRLATMGVSLFILIGTGVLFTQIPKGFLPSEDRDIMFAFTEAAQGISYKSMQDHQRAINKILIEEPTLQGGISVSNARGASNQGIFFMNLKPRAKRDVSVDQVIERLRPKLAKIPGMITFMQNPPAIQIGGRYTKSLYQYTLQGPDTKELYKSAGALLAKMSTLPDLQDVTSDMMLTNPQVNIEIQRDAASSYGLTAGQIEDALYYAYGSRLVSEILTSTDQYDVIVEVENPYQLDPGALNMLYIRSNNGQLVPLNAIAKMTTDVGPLMVNHSGQLTSATISFNLKPGVSVGQAVDEVDKLAKTICPATITTNFQGTAQAFQSSQAGLGLLLAAAILVIYMVLGILYESFIHPLTILSALPFAGFGALLTLLIFRTDLSLYAYVGIIMLVGLVKKNGIMMVDFAIEGRHQGKNAHDAILEACLIRFRPIMMTTMAALMAAMPIALGFGAGAEARRPLGLAVVGGLLFSQTLTLLVTPVFYVYMENLQTWLNKRKQAAHELKSLEPARKHTQTAIPA